MRPTDVNGINKAAGEYYHLVYNNVFGVRACSLRLTNVYGPRQLISHNRQGFIGWFIRLAIEDRTIQIYGDGSQLRDFVYVDDAADAFLRAGASDACNGEVFNVGGDEPISHRDLTTLLIEVAGVGPRATTSSGRRTRRRSTSAASTPTRRSSRTRPAGRRPCRCADGLRRTIAFYREHLDRYVGARRRSRRARERATGFRSCRSCPGEDAADVRRAIDRVIDRGWFVLGPEVERVRSRSSPPRPARPTRSASAPAPTRIALILRALGIGAGDEVITSPLSAAYTRARDHDGRRAAGVRRHRSERADDRSRPDRGARSGRARARSCRCTSTDSRPTWRRSSAIADAAQPRDRRGLLPGASGDVGGRPVGTIGVAGAFSFYPTKNLGALGDGGAVVTNDAALADRVKRLRNGGQTDRYHHRSRASTRGSTTCRRRSCARGCRGCRGWTARRRALAARYRRAPGRRAGRAACRSAIAGHVYHLFVVRTPERDALQAHLAASGIETLIHYPVPIPRQPALAAQNPAECPVAARVCGEILSLPLHPALRDDEVDEIAAAVHAFQPRTVVS